MSATRRDFLKTIGAATVGPALLPRAAAAQQGEIKPNVLVIMCDQLTARVMSCYGGPVATPHMDRIASEGVVFEEATCPTPVCSPSRASFVMGQYPHTHGIVTNVAGGRQKERPPQPGLTPEDATTEKILHGDGYATHHYGKWHLEGAKPLPYYSDMYGPNDYGKEMEGRFEEVRKTDPSGWMRFYNWALPVDVAPSVRQAAAALGDKWAKVRYADFIVKMGRLTWPLKDHYDVRVADRTVKRLASLGDKPWMVTCSFIAPHDPNVAPSPYYEMFDPDKIELPANRQTREERFEKNWSRQIVADLGEPSLREFLRIYYGMVKLIDDQVGRVLKALDETGKADDTIVVFTADHGDMAGGHGMVWKSTDAFYDDIARVPLMMRYSRRLKPGRMKIAACMSDIMPTLLELTGKAVPEGVQGKSLAPFMAGQRPESEAPPFSFSERIPANRDGTRKVKPGTRGSFMIRGKGWKYIRYAQGDEYLYHLADDPGETKNLAAAQEHKAQKEGLSAELDGWLRRTGYPVSI
ncbi:MAG: sulfatase-like hydrolase/transferase [Planctomycetota bacterium]